MKKAPTKSKPKSAAKPKNPKKPQSKGGRVTYGSGTVDDPWLLETPPRSSQFQAWKDETATPPALVVQVGSTRLSYDLRCLDDVVTMLAKKKDWVPLGTADEGKPTAEGTLEAWARSPGNPLGGYYGLRKGYRGRFANYVPPVLELLGRVELEHEPRNNRVRAK